MSSDHTPLLTAHIFVSKQESITRLVNKLSKSRVTVKVYGPEDVLQEINPKHPRVYISIGPKWSEFTTLNALPSYERNRWLHFTSPAGILPYHLFYCWLKATDPLPVNKQIPLNRFSSETPLVSVFTASYRSKEKIQRPYRSLLNQSYTNWEWVVVDDSGDEDETYTKDLLPLEDPRVRRYRQDARNGYIGAIKRYAAGLCTGEILVEVDHDDELTPDCLEKIVQAFQRNPDCGFAYGDFTEVYEGSNQAHWYGWDCGFGYSVHYRVWVHTMNRWQNVQRQTTVNGITIRHLVGLPNHPRAWTRDCYHLIGGHREELLVADDYDILVRTFLCTKYISIPDLLYIQYRNKNRDNSTFQRNQQIQILVNEINLSYSERIFTRLQELGLPVEQMPYKRVWETSTADAARFTSHLVYKNSDKISYLFPIPFSTPTTEHHQLLEILQKGIETHFRDIEVVIVGRIPSEIEDYASKAPMGAIRWWPMVRDDSLETCIEYAKFCASCNEKIVVLPEKS
ncbi:glycosyltransferase [Neobacillus jeddahensis]|uniref:glycosyltransferase n=1 Tax=Neobacillus jeddahensis TaxID=1461580 RepID=UPI00058C9E0E|nr:glycosyltransferase [Neobacillus jeddahensis]